ncbi:MAG: hypothetical protein BAJALOKI3v1_610012 [Promethearchaeota archaeon]|nr:MAG: hypothetical protein BAJALOKI3v1_610012 [Candidatus Lokiarchaeota archaeon]
MIYTEVIFKYLVEIAPKKSDRNRNTYFWMNWATKTIPTSLSSI